MNKLIVENLNLLYSDGVEALRNININFPINKITVIFGPSGGGKSSFLRVINRLNDLADVESISGRVLLVDGKDNYTDILDKSLDVIALRRRIGMVFARPVVLPFNIRANITYGLEMAGEKDKTQLERKTEFCLKQAALWDEVKDRLEEPAMALSGGQQQRLCLARSLASEPDLILLDEPTSGLDPISTGYIETTLQELKLKYTIILVPHSVQQAARTADFASFFLQGELIEYGLGDELFVNPQDERTANYIEGRFG